MLDGSPYLMRGLEGGLPASGMGSPSVSRIGVSSPALRRGRSTVFFLKQMLLPTPRPCSDLGAVLKWACSVCVWGGRGRRQDTAAPGGVCAT